MEIAAPVVVSAEPDCLFCRSGADAAAAGIPSGARVFDSDGQGLELIDGTPELARVLRTRACLTNVLGVVPEA